MSPDSIRAAQTYLTCQIEERAESTCTALDWNRWAAYSRRDRHGDLVLIQWVKVMKP